MEATIKHYQELYTEWSRIDDLNLSEKVKQVPSQKQFWATRLIDSKVEKLKLERQKKAIKKSVLETMYKESPVNLSKKIEEQVDNSPQLEKITEKIEDIDMVILALDYIYSNVKFVDSSIRNILDDKKLESGIY